jgi:hypothetical protein
LLKSPLSLPSSINIMPCLCYCCSFLTCGLYLSVASRISANEQDSVSVTLSAFVWSFLGINHCAWWF